MKNMGKLLLCGITAGIALVNATPAVACSACRDRLVALAEKNAADAIRFSDKAQDKLAQAQPAEKSAEEKTDAGLVEIKIETPPANFGGTPLNYYGPNLEEKSYKPRAPLMAPAGTTNVAKSKPVTASKPDTNFGKLAFVTDGEKSYEDTSVVELEKGPQWVQIDLGGPHAIYGVVAWHYHAADRVYFDVKVKVADDAEFTKNVREVFNNDHDNSSKEGEGKDKEYIENNKGKLIPVSGEQARFVRLYSNGNTSDENNHYVEVEVFGKPVE